MVWSVRVDRALVLAVAGALLSTLIALLAGPAPASVAQPELTPTPLPRSGSPSPLPSPVAIPFTFGTRAPATAVAAVVADSPPAPPAPPSGAVATPRASEPALGTPAALPRATPAVASTAVLGVSSSVPPPTLTPAPTEDDSRLLDEIRSLREGELLFVASPSMTVGADEIVEVRISREDEEEIRANLATRSAPLSFGIRTATIMRVRLFGAKFQIDALTEEEQVFGGVGVVYWRWRVTPREPGHQLLHLEVDAVVRSGGGRDRSRSLNQLNTDVDVKVTPAYYIETALHQDWKAIGAAAAAIGAAGGTVWGLLFRRRRRRRRGSARSAARA